MRGRRATWLLVLVFASWHAGCGMEPTPIGIGTFEWTIEPVGGLTIQRGTIGSLAIRLNSKVNINSEVEFSLTGDIPANSNPTFNPVRLSSTARDATLRFQPTQSTPVGRYDTVIHANELGFGSHERPLTVSVVTGTAPEFGLIVDPAQFTYTSSNRLLSPTIAFRIQALNGFTGTVDVTVEDPTTPPAVLVLQLTSPVTVTGGGGGGTFIIRLAERATYPSSVTLTVRAVSGSLVQTRELVVNISLLEP
jgi:hypothetical protein